MTTRGQGFKLFDIIVKDLGVSILEFVEVHEGIVDFITHWKLQLWEIVFFTEFKHKGGVLKSKTWDQKYGTIEATKQVLYR
jgi:hypothetical protein